MRLFGVEVRRLLARVMLLVVALVGVAGVVLAVIGVGMSVRPLTETQAAEAERQYQIAVEDWEENGEEWLADCLEQEELERERTGEDVDYGCETMEPQREWFFPTSPELSEQFPTLLSSTSLLFALLALIIGVTATAADMSTGAMGTWLTFIPQRMRVFASRIAAVVAVVVPLTAVLTLLSVLGFYVVHSMVDLTDGMDGEAWGSVAATGGRIVVLGAIAGAAGAALGLLLRHTGAALGVVLGYLVIVENMVGALVSRAQPFLLNPNMTAFVQGKGIYWVNSCTVTDQGTMCEGVEKTISLLHASLFLAVVTAVVVTISALVFRRRDMV